MHALLGICQVQDAPKEICPRQFPARSQVTSIERGWISDRQTEAMMGWHPPFHETIGGSPQWRDLKKKKSTTSPHKIVILGLPPHPQTPMPDCYWSHEGRPFFPLLQPWRDPKQQLVSEEEVEGETDMPTTTSSPLCRLPRPGNEKFSWRTVCSFYIRLD